MSNVQVIPRIFERVGATQFNYHSHLLPEFRVAYFEVPKAGCSTVKSFLHDVMLADKGFTAKFVGDVTSEVHRDMIAHVTVKPFQLGYLELEQVFRSGDWLIFTVVRNPYSRALSAYRSKVAPHRSVVDQIHNLSLSPARAEELSDRPLSFGEFLHALAMKRSSIEFDPHFRPQAMQVSPDLIPYTHIIRLEALNEGMNLIASKFGVPWDGRHRSLRTNARSTEIAAEEIALINYIYREDFEIFDYPKRQPANAVVQAEPDVA